jgi:hypothetical protein
MLFEEENKKNYWQYKWIFGDEQQQYQAKTKTQTMHLEKKWTYKILLWMI